jgi:hypothetical protein
MDGQPVRILAYALPEHPTRARWVPEVLDQSLHVVHNFFPVPTLGPGKEMDLLTASYEGVSRLTYDQGRWHRQKIGAGNQANLKGNRGASEVKQGKLKNGRAFIATIEPWHGNQVVVYTPPTDANTKLWDRHVVDEQLRWGHGVWCADLDGDGNDAIVIGVRDNLSDNAGSRRGVRIYRVEDENGTKWQRQILDDGGVAVEDLAVADLDNDGRPDIVAVGRQTGNVRIYWNEGRQ